MLSTQWHIGNVTAPCAGRRELNSSQKSYLKLFKQKLQFHEVSRSFTGAGKTKRDLIIHFNILHRLVELNR